ncbi:MAG: hypothetical protein J7578_13335 [Chitinophagaceae bacterium]|nr:hypothetical protein [Chitinophagaceae bacterium]
MKTLLALLFLVTSVSMQAQKRSFDIVSYAAPSGWTEEVKDSYISYSKATGSNWSQIVIYKSIVSKGDIVSDMQSEWETVVLSVHAIQDEQKSKQENSKGWEQLSRAGTWKYNGANVATILMVFSNGKNCVSVLCNGTSEEFLKEFIQMVQSIELPPPSKAEAVIAKSSNTSAGNSSSILGLWTSYNIESSGVTNGMPVPTGGYFRREYFFFENGTYLFKAKDWSVYMKEILFMYETGKYEIKGNQLILTPDKGKGEWWSKAASGRTVGWGSRVKPANFKQEKVTYNFEVRYLSGMNRSYLYMRASKPTERDGSKSNQPGAQHEFSYGKRAKPEEPLIDNPPGTKTGIEEKY